jgi:hypothetical protein
VKTISLRCTPAQFTRWTNAAMQAGVSRQTWIESILDELTKEPPVTIYNYLPKGWVYMPHDLIDWGINPMTNRPYDDSPGVIERIAAEMNAAIEAQRAAAPINEDSPDEGSQMDEDLARFRITPEDLQTIEFGGPGPLMPDGSVPADYTGPPPAESFDLRTEGVRHLVIDPGGDTPGLVFDASSAGTSEPPEPPNPGTEAPSVPPNAVHPGDFDPIDPPVTENLILLDDVPDPIPMQTARGIELVPPQGWVLCPRKHCVRPDTECARCQ